MKFLRWNAIALVLAVVAALGLLVGFVADEMRIGALNRDLATVQDQKNSLAAELQTAKGDASAAKAQARALATRVAGLEAQIAAAQSNEVQWNSQTLTFKSDYDSTSQPYILLAPKNLAQGKHPLVVYLHSMGNGPDEILKFQAGAETLVSFLIRREVIIASPTYRGDSWLNAAAASDVSQMIRGVQARFPIGPLIMAGFSMGGTAALMYPLLAPNDISVNGLVAASFASDVTTLWSETKNAQVKESLRAAYGGSPDEKAAVYDERAVLRNIIRLPASVPVALYADYSDSMIPTAQQTRLRDALAVRGNPTLYVVLPGDHHLESLDEGFAFVLNRVSAR